MNLKGLRLVSRRVMHEGQFVSASMYVSDTRIWQEKGGYRVMSVQLDGFYRLFDQVAEVAVSVRSGSGSSGFCYIR